MAACAGLGLEIGRQDLRAQVPGWPAGHGAGDDGRLTMAVTGSLGRRRVRAAGRVVDGDNRRLPQRRTSPTSGLKSRLAGFIRRWQPGQSGESDLLAGGQYTNLSVRQ